MKEYMMMAKIFSDFSSQSIQNGVLQPFAWSSKVERDRRNSVFADMRSKVGRIQY